MRRASAQFRNLWDAALVLARPQVEEVLADRALNGVQETVFYHGEEVATRTRYDSRLLLAHLARLDRIASGSGIAATVRDFDREVERLLDPPALYDWDDEEEEEEGWEDAGWQDGRWADEDDGDDQDGAPEDEEQAEDAQAYGAEAGADADADADGAEADGAEADAGAQAAADGAGQDGLPDGAEAAADALSEGGRGAGSGAGGFAFLDSVSCVSNRRCGEAGGADARGDAGAHGGAHGGGDGDAGGGQGRDGPSCRVLHH
jgi:hypothetical protein